MRALVIEDDEQIAAVNKRVLEGEGFDVETAATLSDGQRLALGNDYDIIVTDLMLPDGHGLAIVESVRGSGKGTPILVLTGVDAVESTVTALDFGADDYLRKPYRIDELRARIRALMRRGQAGVSTQLTCGNITMNRMSREARVNHRALNLTPKEFTLLEFFISCRNKPVARAELLEKVWRIDFETGTNIVDVNVARLRAKLTALGATCRIDAERGVGYKFTEGGKDST
ncbi:MAG: response regulator transcription factor [Gemmatimonadaceae bacterium]